MNAFRLERYFAKYEFSSPYLLSCSDCESINIDDLLNMADDESRNRYNNLSLGYTNSKGDPLLRLEISKLYNRKISANDVLVLTPEEGIYISMRSLLSSKDHVIVTYPGYQSLYEIANDIGCEVSKWEPDEANGFSFDVEKVKGMIKPNTKMIIINFPHNPTGAMLDVNQSKELIEIANENNLIIFSDEMYRFLEYNDVDEISICDNYENGISLCGVSKSFSLPGLRIGWLATKNKEIMEKLCTYKDYTTICSSAPSEILACIALENKERIISRNKKIIKENLAILDAFFEKYKDVFACNMPKAGPILFARLNDKYKADAFCEKLVNESGVMLLPSTQYEYGNSHVRIGFGRKNMKESINELEKFIINMKGII